MYQCFTCGSRYPVKVALCLVCLGSLIGIAPQRPGAELDLQLHTATARELAARAWDMIGSRSYDELRLLVGGLVAVYGPPGSGKSTWLTCFLDGLKGPVGLIASEEGLSPSTSERLSRLNVRREDFYILSGGTLDDLVEQVRRKKVRGLGVDSVTETTFMPRDLRRIIAACGLDVLAFSLQVSKALTPSGSNRLVHEADVVIAVELGRWSVEKSRYQGPCGPFEVLNAA